MLSTVSSITVYVVSIVQKRANFSDREFSGEEGGWKKEIGVTDTIGQQLFVLCSESFNYKLIC
jgi:hypothetical protein